MMQSTCAGVIGRFDGRFGLPHRRIGYIQHEKTKGVRRKMSEEKKTGIVKQFFDKLRHANQEEHSAAVDPAARLGYEKGNIGQNQPKNVEVWDTCPVLDEQGKPLKDENVQAGK